MSRDRAGLPINMETPGFVVAISLKVLFFVHLAKRGKYRDPGFITFLKKTRKIEKKYLHTRSLYCILVPLALGGKKGTRRLKTLEYLLSDRPRRRKLLCYQVISAENCQPE